MRQPLFISTLASAVLALPALAQQQPTELLKRYCVSCHSAQSHMGGLVLERRELAIKGGASGPAIVAGDADRSLLMDKIRSGKMPPGNPLPEVARQTLAKWIADGAPWTETIAVSERKRAGKDWWSLQPLKPLESPKVTNKNLCRSH